MHDNAIKSLSADSSAVAALVEATPTNPEFDAMLERAVSIYERSRVLSDRQLELLAVGVIEPASTPAAAQPLRWAKFVNNN